MEIHIQDICTSYYDWIPAWLSHLTGLLGEIKVPPEATEITSPLLAKNWETLLANHPNRQLVDIFIKGLSQGFRIGYK